MKGDYFSSGKDIAFHTVWTIFAVHFSRMIKTRIHFNGHRS